MKVALFGSGFMGETHRKGLAALPGVEIAAIATKAPLEAAENIRLYSDYRDALRDGGFDAVDICLPTNLHLPATLAALEAGLHVFVEKPMAMSFDDAQSMIDTAKTAKRVLMVGHVLRFMPPYLALAGALKGIGQRRSALFRRRSSAPGWAEWFTDREQSGGGVFDLLIHDVDFALFLFGPPAAVAATGHTDLARRLDVLDARLFYEDGFAVTITGGWHHPKSYPFSMEYTVVGDEATIEYNSAGRPATRYGVDGSAEKIEAGDRDGYEAELDYFIHCCQTGGPPLLCPPEAAAEAVKLTRVLKEARARRGEMIRL